MDLDFDDSPSDQAAPTARAGARFKPKGRPQPKKKQVSFSESQTTLPTDVSKEHSLSTSLDESSTYPSKDLTSETNVPESGTEPFYDNADMLSRGFDWSTEPSLLRTCTNGDFKGKRCDDDIETAPVFPYDPKTKDSEMFGDFVTSELDEDIYAQAERMQTGDGECHLDMETLDIVQDEGITSAYACVEQHTGKFQPKPRLLDTVIEEPESHYSVDDTDYFSMGTNESELMANEESRKDFHTNMTFDRKLHEDINIPEVLEESVPEMEVQNASGGWDHEEQVVSQSTNNIVEEEQSRRETKMGKKKRAAGRKRKTTSEGESNKSSENLEKKKFKKSSRRQKRTLEKELLETPDDEIRFLPIRDMLRLVEYKEWLEKKEAKGAAAAAAAAAAPVPPTQETGNMNAWNNHYDSQDFGEEDEFGMVDGENQETNEIKPDSPVNYQTYMNKSSRTRWSKDDTQLFYEGIQEFGSNLSMVQQLFPDRTRQQIKLKFKLEERRFPLKLNDALSSRPKHLTHFQNVIKKLQQEAAAAAREGEEEEEEETAEAETTTDVPEGEEPPKSEETERVSDGVKESDGGDVEYVVRSDGGDEHDDEGDDFWNSYKSDM